MMRFLKIVKLIGVGAIAFFIASLIWDAFSFRRSLQTKTLPSDYVGVVQARANRSPGYAFLPKVIHAEAEDVSFFNVPGFMQGGDIVCLRLTLPERILDPGDKPTAHLAQISHHYCD
jgi:hypothetical protein